MKKLIISIFTILLPSIQIFSQWSQISTVNTPQLNAVKFFDEHTGIVVGQGGIWRSTDSGFNWTQVLSKLNVNSVSFPNISTGYVVCDSSKIYKTTNNGLNWTEQFFYSTFNLYSVSFFNSSTGFIVGQNGIILRTTNEGSFWFQRPNPMSEDLNCVQMTANTQTALAVGSSSLNHLLFCATDNGGIYWNYTLNIPNNYLNYIFAIPSHNGHFMAVGTNGVIIKTTNFGSWFNAISSPTIQTLNCIIFIDSTLGYIAGNGGKILKTTTSGNNWTEQVSGTINNLKSVSFINSQTGWAVGQNGIVLRTGIPVNIPENSNYIPKEFKLYQNYPNPFNPNTKIRFDIDKNNSHVVLNIYDMIGRKIQTLVDGNLDLGTYETDWNAEDNASGVYVCQLKLDDKYYYKKMILNK